MKWAIIVSLPVVGAILWILYDGGWQKPALLSEGVYQTCEEVSGVSGETLELREGRFRYWFYSDVITGNEPAYPLSGTYRIKGNTLVLQHPDVPDKERLIDTLNGLHILWRDDGLTFWQKEKQIQPYTVLIHTSKATPDESPRPSVDLLYTNEMRERRARSSEQIFANLPAGARDIFRAMRSQREYTREIIKVRREPDLEVLGQLVALMEHHSGLNIDARQILRDIFELPPFVPGVPVATISEDELHRLLIKLIDAFSSARDSYALQDAIMIFLEASGVREIDLKIVEGGVCVKLGVQVGLDGAKHYRYASGEIGEKSARPHDDTWSEKLSIIVPACQRWAREHLKN